MRTPVAENDVNGKSSENVNRLSLTNLLSCLFLHIMIFLITFLAHMPKFTKKKLASFQNSVLRALNNPSVPFIPISNFSHLLSMSYKLS